MHSLKYCAGPLGICAFFLSTLLLLPTMTTNHVHRRRPHSSALVTIYPRGKLLLLIILLSYQFIRNTEANDRDEHKAINLRRHMQQSSGRQSDTGDTGDCILNSYGVYGTIDTFETSTISIIYNIEYLYQVSVTIGTQFSSDILRPIDSVITTEIIPSFFPNCTNNQFSQTTENNGAIITAISSTPVDTYVASGCT